MKSEIVLPLNHRKGNPRNSEGSFVTLADGRILFAYTHYRGAKKWDDHMAAVIAARYSEDGGRTWLPKDTILVEKEGACNVMSVSLLRLQDGRIALGYLRKNGPDDCRMYLRFSDDEAKTWSQPTLCCPPMGYFVINNDRLIQLKSGRLVAPAAFHRCRKASSRKDDFSALDPRGIAMFFLSDDGGKNWRESQEWWALPVRSWTGLQEPGAVELKDGRLYAYCRTDRGCQYEMFSEDGGETWSPPRPSKFKTTASPLSIKRIPATGDLLAVWNDHSERWRLPKPWKSSWLRTPLVAAISRNEGRTWERAKLIEKDHRRGFCYIAIHFAEDAALLAYCCGGRGGAVLQDLCIRRISLDWLYAR